MLGLKPEHNPGRPDESSQTGSGSIEHRSDQGERRRVREKNSGRTGRSRRFVDLSDYGDRMRIHPTLRSRAVPIDSVVPWEDNPRLGHVAKIRESFRAHGQYQTIVVQKSTSLVIAGNHRWHAAKAEGWAKIAATLLDVDDEEALRIALVDNKTSDDAVYNDPLLAKHLAAFAETEAGLAGTGFDDDDLDDLNARIQEAEGTDLDRAGMEQHPNLDEYASGYRTKFVRSILLDYSGARYLWMVDRFAELRERYNVDSNADAARELFVEIFPDAPDLPGEDEMG